MNYALSWPGITDADFSWWGLLRASGQELQGAQVPHPSQSFADSVTLAVWLQPLKQPARKSSCVMEQGDTLGLEEMFIMHWASTVPTEYTHVYAYV